MTNQTNETGVSGRKLIPVVLGVLSVIFVLSLMLTPPKEVGNIGLYFFRLGVEAIVVVVAIYGQAYVWFKHVLDVPLNWKSFVAKFKISSNNSYAFTLLGILANSVAIALAGSGKGVDTYLLTIGLRGPIGLALGIAITFLIAYLAGLRSLDDYKKWVEEPHNDNHAIVVAGVNTFFLILALFA